jgi:hypothetical protein
MVFLLLKQCALFICACCSTANLECALLLLLPLLGKYMLFFMLKNVHDKLYCCFCCTALCHLRGWVMHATCTLNLARCMFDT